MLRPNLVKHNEELRKLDIAYMGMFKSADGQLVLKDLVSQFMPAKITTDNAHTTALRARGVDFILYIQRRIEDGVKGISVK